MVEPLDPLRLVYNKLCVQRERRRRGRKKGVKREKNIHVHVHIYLNYNYYDHKKFPKNIEIKTADAHASTVSAHI